MISREVMRCRKSLILFPEAPSDPLAVLGEIAHIVGHSEDGPRGEEPFRGTDRDGPENLILLCTEHHTIIDQHPQSHPTAWLYQIKENHERWVNELLSPNQHFSDSLYTDNFYSKQVASLINFHVRAFIKRHPQLDRLMSFSLKEVPGYLLVEAKAGYGKTALIATLIHHHQQGYWGNAKMPSLLYYFVRKADRDQQAKYYFEALNQQLMKHLCIPERLPVNIDELRRQFISLWSEAVQHASVDNPLLLLVDGLDEIVEHTSINIAELLPHNLAPYVHVIVTSRPNPSAKERLRHDYLHPLREASMIELEAFGEADILYLLQRNQALDPLTHHLAKRIHLMTQGEPLFVRFVCQDVAQGGEAALIHLEQNAPKDVKAYFQSELQSFVSTANSELQADILGIFCVAHGGIARQELAEVLKVTRLRIDEAIEPLMRYFIGSERLELMHLKLLEAMEEQYKDRKSQYIRRIARWGQRYRNACWPHDTPQYLVAYYAQHLYQNREVQTLYELLNPIWMKIQFERTSSYRTFAENVLLIIKALTEQKPNTLVQIIHASFVYSTLYHLAEDLSPEMLGLVAQLESIDKAIDFADLMQNKQQKSEAYLLMSRVLLEQGKQQEALFTLKKARQAAEGIPDRNADARNAKLEEIAFIFLRAGYLDQALDSVEIISSGSTQITLLCQMLACLAEIDQREYLSRVVSFAILLIQRQEQAYPWYLDRLYRELGETCVQIAERERATSILNLVHDEWEKMKLLDCLILSLIEAGQLPFARAFILQLQECIDKAQEEWRFGIACTTEKATILQRISTALFMQSEKTLALSLINQGVVLTKTMASYSRVNIVRQFVEILLQFEEREHAQQHIQSLGDPLLREHGRQQALVLGKGENQQNEAWAALDATYAEWQRLQLLGKLAQAWLQIGDQGQASLLLEQLLLEIPLILELHRETAKLLKACSALDEFDQCDWYHQDIECQTRQLRAATLTCCVNVLASLRKLVPALAQMPWLLNRAWYAVMSTLIQHQQREVALELLAQEKDEHGEYWNRDQAIWAFLQLGEVNTALQLAQRLVQKGKSPFWPDNDLLSASIQSGKLDDAFFLLKIRMRYLRGREMQDDLPQIFSQLIQGFIEQQEWEKALEASTLTEYRSGAEDELLFSLLDAGDMSRATAFALRMLQKAEPYPTMAVLRQMFQQGYVKDILAKAESLSDEEVQCNFFIAILGVLIEQEHEEELENGASFTLAALEGLYRKQKYHRTGQSGELLTVNIAQLAQRFLALLVQIHAYQLISDLFQKTQDQDIRNILLDELVQVSLYHHEYIYAHKMARTISERSVRIAALSKVALAWAEHDKKSAIKVVHEVLVSQPLEFEIEKAQCMSTFAALFIRAGRIDNGCAIVAALQKGGVHTSQLSQIVKASAEVGQFRLAEKIAQTIDHQGVRAWAFGEIATILVRQDEWNQALPFAQAIASVNPLCSVDKVQRQIIAALLVKGCFDLALTIAKQISWYDKSAQAVYSVIDAMIRNGLELSALAQANQAISEAQQQNEQIEASLYCIQAKALVYLGKIDQAFQEMEKIEPATTRFDCLTAIAQALSERQHLSQASQLAKQGIVLLRSLRENGDLWIIRQSMLSLLALLTRTGEAALALEILPLIHDTGANLQARCTIAQVLIESGDQEKAVALVSKAVMLDGPKAYAVVAYQHTSSHHISQQILQETVRIMLQAGQYEQLLANMREIDDTEGADALSDLVTVLCELEEIEKALHTLDYIKDSLGKSHALKTVAMHVAQIRPKSRKKITSCVQEILSLAMTKGRTGDISYILTHIIPMLNEKGEKDVASELIHQTVDAVSDVQEQAEKATLLSQIAVAWDLIGCKAFALDALYDALASASCADRNDVLQVLEICAPFLASFENGQMLWEIYNAIQSVDAWWNTRKE